ncbi:uncharacterized protein MAM_04548 [Metarhizium album ARSEF 1941]|uniref:DUF7371 domain-containing protein n=1 Tax=Metarhizium album (strain ARSEF 1941) TaxID=1081103 RepID=A0A0B2WTZ8_METAS|nr:uncharacterized protein MAM_04548 [Metarhizium album ARSEF 1941]KHN97533.1 hypothetical protein MAM_04548 [Metarhizium album ARSEF 1941]
MRASLNLGAVVASSLLAPDDSNDTGSSAGQVNSPQSTVVITSSGDNSNGLPNGQSCQMQGTTTVFVTVYPTSPVSNGNESPAAITGTDGTPDHTGYQTIQVSPLNSANGNQPTVEIFTTVTVSNLWGTGSDASNPTSVATSESTHSDASSPSGSTTPDTPGSVSVKSPGDNGSATEGTAQNAPSNSLYMTDYTGQVTANPNGGDGGARSTAVHPPNLYTIVTDTKLDWITGSNGIQSLVTVVSEHTITLGTAAAEAISGSGPAVTCWTVTGTDGKETVLESVINTNQGNGGAPAATSASIVGPDGNVSPQAVSTVLGQQTPVTTITANGATPVYTGPGIVATTAITVLGPDGITTVVHSTWVIESSPVTDASAALPTGISVPPGATQAPSNGQAITSCTSYTVIGPDGRPTVIESTLVIPASAVLVTELPQNLPNGISIQATNVPGSPVPGEGAITARSSYTVVGADGRLTVVETSFLVPGPSAAPVTTVAPSGVVTGVPGQITATPSQFGSVEMSSEGLTTCTTYTFLGTDGLPTVFESTIVMPKSNLLPTGTIIGLPSIVPEGQDNELPQGVTVPAQTGAGYTACVTVDVLGPNGVATPVVETIVLTPQTPGPVGATVPVTSLGFPSVVTSGLGNLPQGITPSGTVALSPVTTAVTLTVVGPNGVASPVVQTIVITPQPQAVPSGATNSVTIPGAGSSIPPALEEYATGIPTNPTVLFPPGISSEVGGLPVGTDNGAKPSVFTIVTGPGGIPVLSVITAAPLSVYGNPGSADNNGTPVSGPAPQGMPGAYGWQPAGVSPAEYGALPTLVNPQVGPVATSVQTSTWVNVIPEPTTTYTMKFPVTTLTTVTVPAKASVLKRLVQHPRGPAALSASWSNSTSASLQPFTESEAMVSPSVDPTSNPSDAGVVAPSPAPATAMCPTGGKVGNTTVNFDNVKPGPLFNPAGDFWFSEGFLVTPLSSQSVQGYTASSGGQLVEFVPPALTGPALSGCSDTAEIGVGPNSPNPCFRFNLYSANLGCAAQAAEQWCEFEVSAYTYNQAASNEMSIAWSEVKRVPACPSFPNSPCSLTPVTFDGYQNISSVLVRLHVGLELRTWWADDVQFGWTDNSCEAAQCRQAVAPQPVKREAVESALRHGVWRWTPAGHERMGEEYVWDSLN